ncbi:anti-phage defense-associated sirtuin Dsr1 [Escherichia coli]|uniref:anti-phage defense-associated sirtuin Dsr1 n=3 Tax=Escherichia coli TaxID=562 RepID=UPI000F9ED4F0|nr:anti-phage defense-associated sirtuin Dsr1 [Escherichia coli]EIH0335780.1 SIR2 family protein [Escherichia coli O22]EFL9677805.1 hypothetical protein [Escherichia coli]EFN3929751.1 hypothetical protein [Escherichia coli]EHZ2478865.1 SIR2 family protein [Escherichia coli]EIH2568428.1 SIR2 family protein [Escherichia coli]
MQFITNGPDIPDSLLQAHEEGKVVFFCGAGISYPAGLPGFGDLVDNIYQRIGETRNALEEAAYKAYQYDTTLELLERRIVGNKQTVRYALSQILKPKVRRKNALTTHNALLQLSQDQGGRIRLVTTNFDHLFDIAAKNMEKKLTSYLAPMLPVPKNSRWNGVVYLHGILPHDKKNHTELNRLVVTSGDFGCAYLTERWAARFVSELFRNYVVCFIGYSINDPVLRYMMDALAADRMLGEYTPQAYAFADYKPNEESTTAEIWEAKGVIPVLYKTTKKHELLHETLKIWGEIYNNGSMGKERIVAQYVIAHPSTSTQEDNFVGRVLWALSDNSGKPAKRLAEMNPAPTLSWLWEFEKKSYRYPDLPRFNTPAHSEFDPNLQFSLINRPSSYKLSPRMSLASFGGEFCQWDSVMVYICLWLIKHIGNVDLIIWLAKQGGKLHPQLSNLISNRLSEIERLERNNEEQSLKRIKQEGLHAIPSQNLRAIWRLFLAGRIGTNSSVYENNYWIDQFQHGNFNMACRLALRKILAPTLILQQPFQLNFNKSSQNEKNISQSVRHELNISTDLYWLQDLENKSIWKEILPSLFDDLQQLLLDAMDLQFELNDNSISASDRSFWDLPSITPHWQNRGYRNWVKLIELLRDSWLQIYEIDKNKAKKLALNWWSFPYPVFKRLVIFSASYNECIDAKEWVNLLLEQNGYWLWAIDTHREVCRLFVLQGKTLTAIEQRKLENAITLGYSQELFNISINENEWENIVERNIWLFLSKLQFSGVKLNINAQNKLDFLSEKHPYWKLTTNERDEFSHWMSGTGDPDFEEEIITEMVPDTKDGIINWLRERADNKKSSPFERDNWIEICKQNLPMIVCVLRELAMEDIWPCKYWRSGLQTWCDKDLIQESWQEIGPLLLNIPDDLFPEIQHSLAQWLAKISTGMSELNDVYTTYCQRIIDFSYDETDDYKSIIQAINHPVGNITQALINIWLNGKPHDNEGIPDKLKVFFTKLCDTHNISFRNSRVILASNLIPLFRVDTNWAKKYLLPLFIWDSNFLEAKSVWPGFLWTPRLYAPLLAAFKQAFLKTAEHYQDLGDTDAKKQYTIFLTYAALEPTKDYVLDDYQKAFRNLPSESLIISTNTLVDAIESSGEQYSEYWDNCIKIFLKKIWPKSQKLRTPGISENLVQLCIAGQDRFQDIFDTVKPWIIPFEWPHYTLKKLYESEIPNKFPSQTLELISLIMDNQRGCAEEIEICLVDIIKAKKKLINTPQYKRLVEFKK